MLYLKFLFCIFFYSQMPMSKVLIMKAVRVFLMPAPPDPKNW